MNIPETIGIGYIEGRWLAAALDNLDPDLRPQAEQINTLRVEITPTSPQVRVELPTGPTMLWIKDAVLVTNQAGEVVNPRTGGSTVAVIATDNPGAEFRYLVKVTADGMPTRTAQIEVASNATLDLADLDAWPVPLPGELERWEAAMAEFRSYRDQVVGASNAITLALDGQDLAVVASWAADTQSARTDVLAAKASLDASIAGLDIPTLEGLRDDIQLSVITNEGYSQSAATSATDASAAQIAAEEARDEAVQAATGGVIDDDATSLDFTWSSDKISTGLGVKSDHGHTHQQADVDGLTDALDARPLMTAVTALLAGKSDISHSHSQSDVTGLVDALAGKAEASHSHEIAHVTGLQSALDGKSPVAHTHPTEDIEGLLEAILAALPFKVWVGVETISIDSASAGTRSINFPVGHFTAPPVVVATRDTATSAYWQPYVSARSTSGTTVGAFNTQGTNATVAIRVNVIAIQVL